MIECFYSWAPFGEIVFVAECCLLSNIGLVCHQLACAGGSRPLLAAGKSCEKCRMPAPNI